MASKSANNLFLILIALLISVFLNQDRIIRSFWNDSNKHAVPIASSRTFLGDEYHYYVEANDSLKIGLISKDKVYSTNNVLLGSLVTSGLINLLCQSLINTSDIAVLISLFLQTFILVLATIYIIKKIGGYEESKQGFWLGFWAFITLILTDYFIYNSYEGAVHFKNLLSYYPNILRVVNPQMGWAFGFLYLGILFAFSNAHTTFKFISLAILSLIFSFFSPSLCLTMLLAMSMMIIWYYLKNKSINYFYLICGLCLLISFLFNYIQLHHFQMSPKGVEIATGVIKNIVFRSHYFVFLILIIPIGYYYKGEPFVILTSVLISSIMIGAFCETLYLGERLWIRGAGIYVWIICIVLISNFFKNMKYIQVYSAFGFLLLSLWTYFLLPHQFNNDYGYIKTEKWVLIDWINKNVAKNSIIMSEDLEFSYLLPIYTQSHPFIPLFSYSNLSAEETVKRYYYTLDTYRSRERVQKTLKDFDLQKSTQNLLLVTSGKELDDNSFIQNAFFNYLVYYPFTKFSKLAFDSESESEKFFNTLDNWSREPYLGSTKIDYVIVRTDKISELELDIKPVFRTKMYILGYIDKPN